MVGPKAVLGNPLRGRAAFWNAPVVTPASLTLALADEGATVALAERLAPLLRPGDLVFLEGELGAGKTFFVRALARALGLPEDVPVQSPTFTLVHELDEARIPIVHADLYRLDDPDEVSELGLSDRIGRDAVVLVEWGERRREALSEPTLVVRLRIVSEHGREVCVEGLGARGRGIVSALADA
jgi:tRNA threonylcarbamoyladenosine biosynthesis protein TsaE